MKVQNTSKIIALSLIAAIGIMTPLQAGMIGPLVDQADPAKSSGFGGWDLGNVDVKITAIGYDKDTTKSFDKTDGSYDEMDRSNSFESDLYNSVDTSGEVLVHLHGKDWPVGEPAGIKVLNQTDPDQTLSRNRPASCIMNTSFLEGSYLDSAEPKETLCSSDFQSHKRFKLNMLPTMVSTIDADGYGTGVNLTFNVEAEDGTRRYMVLHKINNYTGKRLDGYKLELGFIGADGNFTKVSELTTPADLRLSIGEGEDSGADIWGDEDLAAFSHGLFGPKTDEEPLPHFPEDGFFDNRSAGFFVELNATTKDIIRSTGPLPSNYAALPVSGGSVATQFGDWLPSIWAPEGIFWDFDNDPSTDADLMAFWGDRGDGNYAWLKGNRDGFAEVTAVELATWASDPLYGVDVVEDVLNLGLTYIIEVGEISTFPSTNFTIRITPHIPTTQTAPGYVANPPADIGDYISSEGKVLIQPAPAFTVGDNLLLSVADLDLNNTGTLDVNVSVGSVWKMITLNEVVERPSIFSQTLSTVDGPSPIITDTTITLHKDAVVTVTYIDADNGSTGEATVSASTTAQTEDVTPPNDGDDNTVINNDDDKGIFATMDNTSLFAMIFGFLAIGGLIARRKLVK